MTVLDVTVSAPDGECPASLHLPEGKGPWPAVILYPDAGGVRETFRAMADRLSGLGYAVLLPDVYYRAGGFEWGNPPGLDLAACSEQWASLPLLFQPGSEWNYSIATDVLGRLVEVVSGLSLDEFFS